MRLWIFAIGIIWGLIACTSQVAPLPPPTGAPLSLTIHDTEINFTSTDGWQVYALPDGVILVSEDRQMPDTVVHIWLPQIDMTEFETFSDAVFSIARTIEDEQNLLVTRPIPFSWDEHEAAYFLMTNETQESSMIMVLYPGNEHIVALNIRGVDNEFALLRDRLAALFADFKVNDVVAGNTIFTLLPDALMLPPQNPRAALEASPEP